MVVTVFDWKDFVAMATKTNPPLVTIAYNTVEEETTIRYVVVAAAGDFTTPWFIYSNVELTQSKNDVDTTKIDDIIQERKRELQKALPCSTVVSGVYLQQ